ncbi:MAG TPA: hypothetical protein QF353_03450 [Gammaproteobacteria bacterium]|nr:hypothetical protein [Gammaproteobacteria bacterium]
MTFTTLRPLDSDTIHHGALLDPATMHSPVRANQAQVAPSIKETRRAKQRLFAQNHNPHTQNSENRWNQLNLQDNNNQTQRLTIPLIDNISEIHSRTHSPRRLTF